MTHLTNIRATRITSGLTSGLALGLAALAGGCNGMADRGGTLVFLAIAIVGGALGLGWLIATVQMAVEDYRRRG